MKDLSKLKDDLLRQNIEIKCEKCKNLIKVTLKQVQNKQIVKCSKCGAEHRAN